MVKNKDGNSCTIPHPNPNGCSCHERQGVWKQICKGGILSSLAIYDHHWNNVENKANKANFPHDDLFRGIIPGFSDGIYDHHQNNVENKANRYSLLSKFQAFKVDLIGFGHHQVFWVFECLYINIARARYLRNLDIHYYQNNVGGSQSASINQMDRPWPGPGILNFE